MRKEGRYVNRLFVIDMIDDNNSYPRHFEYIDVDMIGFLIPSHKSHIVVKRE